MERQGALKKAEDLIVNEREQQYGSPQANFQNIAALWNAYWGGKPFKPQDVAMFFMLAKAARIKHDATNEDSWIDLIGYAACGVEVTTSKNSNNKNSNN